MLSTLVKYWPLVGTALGIGLNGLALWIAWSLRQLAKNEIAALAEKISGEIRVLDVRLSAKDTTLAGAVAAQESSIVKLEGRMSEVEDDIKDLPTKADLARVEGKVTGVGREVEAVGKGVGRLEGYFLSKGVEAR